MSLNSIADNLITDILSKECPTMQEGEINDYKDILQDDVTNALAGTGDEVVEDTVEFSTSANALDLTPEVKEEVEDIVISYVDSTKEPDEDVQMTSSLNQNTDDLMVAALTQEPNSIEETTDTDFNTEEETTIDSEENFLTEEYAEDTALSEEETVTSDEEGYLTEEYTKTLSEDGDLLLNEDELSLEDETVDEFIIDENTNLEDILLSDDADIEEDESPFSDKITDILFPFKDEILNEEEIESDVIEDDIEEEEDDDSNKSPLDALHSLFDFLTGKKESGDITEEEQKELEEVTQQLNAMQKIEQNYEIDVDMAETFTTQIYTDLANNVDTTEIVGMSVEDAMEVLSDAYMTFVFCACVYSNKVSTSSIDSATIKENQQAVSDFMNSFNEVFVQANTNDVQFLSLADQTSFDAAKLIAKRLSDNEYIKTKELANATSKVDSIELSPIKKKEDRSEKIYNESGFSVLRRLQAIVSDDNTIEENPDDDILTEKEYMEMQDEFVNSDCKASAYQKLVSSASKYGVFKSNVAA